MSAAIAVILAALAGSVLWEVTQTELSLFGALALLPLLLAGASLYRLRERFRWVQVQWILALAFTGLRWAVPPRWVSADVALVALWVLASAVARPERKLQRLPRAVFF